MAVSSIPKALSRYCSLNIIEVSDEKTPDNCSETERDKILEKEAERLMKYIPDSGTPDCHVITLEIKGKKTVQRETG